MEPVTNTGCSLTSYNIAARIIQSDFEIVSIRLTRYILAEILALSYGEPEMNLEDRRLLERAPLCSPKYQSEFTQTGLILRVVADHFSMITPVGKWCLRTPSIEEGRSKTTEQIIAILQRSFGLLPLSTSVYTNEAGESIFSTNYEITQFYGTPLPSATIKGVVSEDLIRKMHAKVQSVWQEVEMERFNE